MNYLNFIRSSFSKVLAVDTEFRFDLTKTIPEKVLCFVYTDVFNPDRVYRFWEDDKGYSSRHFDYDDVLLVSYNSTAEFGSYLKQLHGRPLNVWDAYVETSRLYKPMRSGKGALTLLSTAENYGIQDKLTEAEKEENLDLILRRNKFSDLPFKYSKAEQKQILDYCQSDTEVLRQVFIKQVEDIEQKMQLKTDEDFEGELWRILNRGYAQGCVALAERNGIPVDYKLVKKFNDNWIHVKDSLIKKVNKDLNVFTDDLKFSHDQFDKLIIKNKLQDRWTKMKSGHFTTNKSVIKDNLHVEDIKKFNIIRTFQNMTKLTSYSPGADGRVRTNFNMFGTVTSRATPSSAKYPFSASKWARNFIKPSYGNYLAYIDYASQEPGVMGYLSGDQKLIEAYQSGDIYIHTMKLFKMVPEHATKETHKEERNIGKVLYLANSYGQGPVAVSKSLKCSVSHAKFLQNKYREIYATYFNWIEGIIEAGLERKYLSTNFGWQRHIKDLFTMKNGKRTSIHRSLLNWSIQAHGAEILRKALIDLTDANFEVCALVHDAVLIQIPIPEFEERLADAKRIMVSASEAVVGGPIRVDSEIIKTNYIQSGKDQQLFDDIMEEINRYTRTSVTVHPYREYRPI